MAPIRKVCLIGANGSLGSVILRGLVEAGTFDVSTLRRTNSSSPPAEGAIEIPVSPAFEVQELTRALTGQDAVVAAFPLTHDASAHLRLAEAAYHAGVRRFIPADFGSCDAASPQAQHHLKLYRDKSLVRAKCEELAAGPGVDPTGAVRFSWTTIICGHFFDYGLRSGLLHFDLNQESAQILDGGDIMASASTLGRIAESVVAVLQREEATRNKALYVQSFCPTQLEILASLERATGKKWQVQYLDSNGFLERESQKLASGDHGAVEEIVFVLGTVDANWTRKQGFAMDLLGLQDEDLDKVIARVVTDHKVKE